MSVQSNNERKIKLEKIINLKENICITELAKEFNVSTETIRNDLISLERKKIINKNIELVNTSSNYVENYFDTKLLKNIDKKFKIAQKAVELVPQKGVVILDSGTTVLQIAKLLNFKSDLVIVTSSLAVAQVLENTKNQLLVTGGELRKRSMSFVGHWATKAIEGIQADIAFISCDGFHTNGPCIRSYKELEIKQKIIESSKKIVLVADSSKLSVDGLYRFATFEQIDNLVTDEDIKDDQLQLLPSNIGIIKA